MWLKMIFPALSLVVSMFVLSGISVTNTAQTGSLPKQIALHEAEILIYLLPLAHVLRGDGMEIGWETETSEELNQHDYYFFRVHKANHERSTFPVGYFAINKHTADIWDYRLMKIVNSPELQKVQGVLRKAHGVDKRTTQRHRSRSLWVSKAPAHGGEPATKAENAGRISVTNTTRTGNLPKQIALHEAEILICVLPDAHVIRSDGTEIGWDSTTDPWRNQNDYYFFSVYNAKRKGFPSVTVGHFAVNKHTADTWDTVLFEMLSSPEVRRIQEILRKAHGIDERTIEQYRDRNFHAEDRPPPRGER